MKQTWILIYTQKGIGNCSNHGITDGKYNELILLRPDEGETIDPTKYDHPERYVKLEPSFLPSYDPRPHLIPIMPKKDGNWGYCDGGCIGLEFDNQFGNGRLLGVYDIHDRQETFEDHMSYTD